MQFSNILNWIEEFVSTQTADKISENYDLLSLFVVILKKLLYVTYEAILWIRGNYILLIVIFVIITIAVIAIAIYISREPPF